MRRSWVRWAVWPIALLGVAAEALAHGASDPRSAVPDLLTGWGLLAAGRYAQVERAGPLLVAAAGAWFAGTAFEPLLYLHRGPLLHLLLTFPAGRARTRAERAAVAPGYAASLVEPLWRDELASIASAAAVVGFLAWRHGSAAGRARRARRVALNAGAVLAASIAGGAIVRLAQPSGDLDEPLLAIYELVLVSIGWWLAVAVVTRPWERVALTDLVVDVAERTGASQPGSLARALGEPALAEDPSLQEAISAAAALSASHNRLEAEVRVRLEEVAASQRRLLHAAEDERRRLELDLRERAGVPLLALRDRLAETGRDPEVKRLVAQAARRIELALGDVDAVARGLHPRVLSGGGLLRGLEDLATTSAEDVRVIADLPPLPAEVEATAYYVCAETVANAGKHARARRVVIDAAVCDGQLRLSISDDGIGGARVVRGGGLQGLRDRVAATGGEVTVLSPPAGGTRVEVTLEL